MHATHLDVCSGAVTLLRAANTASATKSGMCAQWLSKETLLG
jgi:hypothetical protein